jgi:hypothetical protein
VLLLAPLWSAAARPISAAGMQWRPIGPFRGGRVVAVSGVPGDPATWYFGVAGGVWKSTDTGASWKPVFDEQKIASISAIAVADPIATSCTSARAKRCRGNITYGDGVCGRSTAAAPGRISGCTIRGTSAP